MSDRIAIEKIVLNIKGKQIELSPEEAQELRKLLNDTLKTEDGIKYWYQPYIYTPYVYTLPTGKAPTVTWGSYTPGVEYVENTLSITI